MSKSRTADPRMYALMERYIDGDPRAFAALHRLLEPRLRALLSKFLSDPQVCDDLLQLTLLKAHLARHRFEVPGNDPDGAVLAWYFAIARNVAMDELRSRYRASERQASTGLSEDPAAGLPDASSNVEDRAAETERELEIVDEVRRAIQRLPPGQREVVELHKLRGMSMAEIAARLGIREGAVRVRAHRAYRALARLLHPRLLPALLWTYWGGA